MKHASLFSGIGGAEIAAEWAGWENVFHVEINPFCRKILEFWYPNSTSYEDIKQTDFTPWHGRIDVLTGGFPCQPFSLAGQRRGAEDDRYLWSEMLRAIREIQPCWVVGENVAGILTMVQPGEEVKVESGFTLFGETDRKRVLLRQEYIVETICSDLEREGYSVQPFVIPACAVGAPHRRDRVWFVARKNSPDATEPRIENQRGRQDEVPADEVSSNPDGNKLQRKCFSRKAEAERWKDENGRFEEYSSNYRGALPAERWRDFPTQPPVCSGNDGLSSQLDGITFPKWRQESIKAYGNAWVPQIAYEIFNAINQISTEL